MISLTPEQYEIREQVLHERGTILVSAGAGTGKSFLARQVVDSLGANKVLYTAFNKAIVVEAQEKFSDPSVECKTLHALAYKYTKPKGTIRSTNYRDLPEDIPYKDKYQILQGLEAFFVSASADMGEFFEDYFEGKEDEILCRGIAEDLVTSMLNRELPWSFSFMLKYLHLLIKENPELVEYDLVILDEINDTTAVSLEIFKELNAPRKLGLGEPHQAIYSFLNLVNGFEELKDVPVYPLTNSFRCNKKIAAGLETFMKDNVTETFKFTGTDNPVRNGKSLFCTLTNSAIIREVVSCLDSSKQFNLLRKPSDIFACCLAVSSAAAGKEIYQTNYKYLEDVYSDWQGGNKEHKTFLVYLLEELSDTEIHAAVRLISWLRNNNINLFDVYAKVKKHRQGGDYTIATVFTAKGLEFETVTLADQFDARISDIINRGGIETEDDLVAFRCYYVAASRCGVNLHNATHLKL